MNLRDKHRVSNNEQLILSCKELKVENRERMLREEFKTLKQRKKNSEKLIHNKNLF